MHKLAVLAICLGLVLTSTCTTPAQADLDQFFFADENGEGYLFSYESLVQLPGGGYDDCYYYYFIMNNSLDHQITSWTWASGDYSGPVTSTGYTDAYVYDNSSDYPLPSPPTTDIDDSFFRAEDFTDYNEPVLVQSIITWEDSHQSTFNIYVPSSQLPEPGSLLAIAGGLIGFGGVLARKRK